MDYEKIFEEWSKTKIRRPDILLLKIHGSFYAVVEDYTSIITVASKSGITYAIAKNNIWLNEEGEFPFYETNNSDNLKIIFCTGVSLSKRHPEQYFVIENIIKYI
jgi:hypothetical protein